MTRQIVGIAGSISYITMPEGLPVRFDPPARSVSLIRHSLALVVLPGTFGAENLVIIGRSGDELVRLGTTCSTGYVDQVLEVKGEIRVIEITPNEAYQSRLDLETFDMQRVGVWR